MSLTEGVSVDARPAIRRGGRQLYNADRKQRWCPGAELNHRHTDFQSVLKWQFTNLIWREIKILRVSWSQNLGYLVAIRISAASAAANLAWSSSSDGNHPP